MNIRSYRCPEPVFRETLRGHGGIQAIDSSLLFGVEHVAYALKAAMRALERNEKISDDIFVDVITRASGQRQIKKAFDMYGLRGSKEIVVFGEKISNDLELFLGAEEFRIEIDQTRLENLKEGFSITDNELKTQGGSLEEVIKALIIERIALISI
jgi:tRNA threonylcarbamoyladenosine modification (KEOPS) complex Cgi121 subunit